MRRTFFGLSALAAIVAFTSSAARADGYIEPPQPYVKAQVQTPLPPLPPRCGNCPAPKVVIHNHFYNVQPPVPLVEEVEETTIYDRGYYAPPPQPLYGYGGRYVGHRPGFYQGNPAGTYVGRKYVPFGGSYGTPPYPRSSTDVYGYGYYLRQNSIAPGY